MLRLGAHESIAGGLHTAFERGASVGCEALQVWVKNSRQWAAPPLTPEEISAFKAARAETGIRPVLAHAAYLINLASPDDALWRRSIGGLVTEVQRCTALEIPYLVLHPGAHTGSGMEAGLARVAVGLGEVHAATSDSPVRILLENTAGQGSHLGADFEALARLIAETPGGERLGICLDTCHLFTAGYELRTPEGYAATMGAFDRIVGLGRLAALHLNDSKHPLGSHRDRHEHIGKGELGVGAFHLLLEDRRLDGLPGILETPKGKTLEEDRENLATLRGLVTNAV